MFYIFTDGKVLDWLSRDDITLLELLDSVTAVLDWQTDVVAVQTPTNEQCGKVTLLVTWKRLNVSEKRQTSPSFQLD